MIHQLKFLRQSRNQNAIRVFPKTNLWHKKKVKMIRDTLRSNKQQITNPRRSLKIKNKENMERNNIGGINNKAFPSQVSKIKENLLTRNLLNKNL